MTTHYVTAEFDLMHHNLTTYLLPGTHDHTNIAYALRKLADEWVIDLESQVSCFTTDNGSNIVKTIKDDLQKMHIPCAGHTLNLSVEAALKERSLTTAIARCRKLVTHFHQSRLDREALTSKQELLELPKHSLIQDVSTRWNSTHDIIKRACEQQPAIAAVLYRRRDLTHLELSSSEWRLLEDVAEVLEPYKDVTTYLSSESYPTISALGPLYIAIQAKLTLSSDGSNSAAIRRFKQLLDNDMSARYQDPNVSLCLNKTSFLDPRSKTLAHLSQCQQEEVLEVLLMSYCCIFLLLKRNIMTVLSLMGMKQSLK